MRRTLGAVIATVTLGASLLVAPQASAEGVPVPPEVTAALANSAVDAQSAATAWAAWAATASMRYVRNGKRPKTRSSCSIDASGVADCNDFAQVVGRGNRNMGMKKISEIITAGKRQFFRDPPLKRWTATRTSSNPNPITGVSSRVGYNPWLPWTDQASEISTQVLENGSLQISATNPAPRESESTRTVARIAANGLQATLLEYDSRGRLSETRRVTITQVSAIKVPRAG
jgi:hypothetical protein